MQKNLPQQDSRPSMLDIEIPGPNGPLRIRLGPSFGRMVIVCVIAILKTVLLFGVDPGTIFKHFIQMVLL